jgi:hypothetical protein
VAAFAGVSLLRRVAFTLRLVRVRLASRATSAVLLALGVAAGAAVLAVVLGGSLVAQDRSVARALQGVPAADRTLTVVYADLGVPRRGVDRPSLEPLVRDVLGRLEPGEPTRVVQYKLLRIGKTLVNLAAVDGLPKWVRLRSGRLPRACSPARCEVLQLGGVGPIPSIPGIRLVKVGEGSLASPALFGKLPGAAAARLGESFAPERQPPFVVAEGFEALSELPVLRSLYRTYAWVLPLTPGSVHPWEIDDLTADVTRGRSALTARSLNLDLVAPVEELTGARETGHAAGRRLLLIGGQAAALLLAFAVLAAATLRRDVHAAWRRLTWFGARRWQLVLLSATETAAVAALGGLVGWGLGAGATAIVADRAGAPPGAVLGHSVLSPAGLAAVAGLVVAAAVVLLLSLRAPTASLAGRALSTVDVAAVGALAVIVFTFGRGTGDARALATEGGTGTLILLLPGLVTFVAAVACARLIVPALRLLGRGARRTGVPVRLASLSLARHPGHAAVAVTFLVVSVGLALFALIYRSTLAQGLDEQAAYTFPLEFTVREDLSPAGLVAPLEAASLSRYRALGRDATVPVIRQSGSVSPLGGRERFTLLGVPADKLGLVDGWRSDFSDVSLAELASRIRSQRPVALRGAEIPPEATELVLPVSVEGGDVVVEAAVLTSRGDVVSVELGATRGRRKDELRAALPARARGGRVIGLTLTRAATVEGHGSDFNRIDGTLTLGPLAAGSAAGRSTLVSDYGTWIGTDNVDASPAARGARLRYLFAGANFAGRFRVRQATDGRPVPVAVSPRLAAAAGRGEILPLRLPGGQLEARVVATVRRFPTAYGDFVLADERMVFVALNAATPGAAVPNEIWIGAGSSERAAAVERAFDRPPLDVLSIGSRAELEQRLRTDPLARGSLVTLAAAAVAALLLALAGLLLLLVSDLRDERGELFDLEAQGVEPAVLRRHLRLRALLVAALGLAGGLATGALLSVLVVDLVVLTANATAPEPPLVLGVDWPLVALAVAVYAVAAAALVATATRRGYRLP